MDGPFADWFSSTRYGPAIADGQLIAVGGIIDTANTSMNGKKSPDHYQIRTAKPVRKNLLMLEDATIGTGVFGNARKTWESFPTKPPTCG